MNITEHLREYLQKIFLELYGVNVDTAFFSLEETSPDFTGDITLIVFPLSKYSRKNPYLTATEIGTALTNKSLFVSGYEVIKGFLNLTISHKYWNTFLLDLDQEAPFEKAKERRKILVEYSSPNTNKPLHLGHTRNNLIGHAISEIYKVRGHQVIKINLINDRGIHICKSMLAWQKFADGEEPEKSGMKGDHFVGKYYVLFEQKLKKEIEELQCKGVPEDDCENQASLMKEARDMLLAWEKGDQEIRALWKKMNAWVLNGFNQTYSQMDISFDKVYFESDTYTMGKSIVEEALQNGTAYQKNDQSVWINLKEQGLDEKLLLRADGTSVYITQDLGTAEQKFQDFKADESVYVVGNEQEYHFTVLRHILNKLSKPYAETIRHLSYGMVDLPSGKMKSREGKVVDADDLMKEMIDLAEDRIINSEKTRDIPSDEIALLAECIGLGALKFFILKNDISKGMLFNPEESIDFQGYTGPFVQYSYARIMSILRKAPSFDLDSLIIDTEIERTEHEIRIIKDIFNVNKILEKAERENDPSHLAHHVYHLAKNYNRFYHDLPVLKEKVREKKDFRLLLSYKTAVIIKKTMYILGIKVPERM
jgi:arginyl-tRNA synthetase